MKSHPTRTLPQHPDLNQLRRQAKELLDASRAGESPAISEINAHYRDVDWATFALHDAQLVIARAYGFESWPKLKAHVDGVTVANLAEAVKADDLERSRAMLHVRPELINMESEANEHIPIHYAVYNQSPGMVRLLMHYGANARKGIWPNRDATSAFTIASERGYDEIVAIMREEEGRRPVPPDDCDPHAWPPELRKVAHDDAGMIAFLEANPAYINVPEWFQAPLHLATSRLRERLANWLLDHGADVNLRAKGGPSPLELAGYHERDPVRTAEMVTLLKSRGAEMSPRAAVAHGEAEWIRARHAEGKLVNRLLATHGAAGLLEVAVEHRRPEMLALLLDLGFDPDEPLQLSDSLQHTRGGPLRKAIETGQTAMAQMLLDRGATLNSYNAVALGMGDWLRAQHAAGSLQTEHLIMTAVQNNRADMLALLLDLGLDPDDRTRLDYEEIVYSYGAPLRECANRGDLEMAKILLDHGANPNTAVYAASSALGNAYGRKDWAMAKLLESYGARLSAGETGYIRQTEIARKMLAGEIDARLEVGTGFNTTTVAETLLWSGASGGDPEIVRMALEKVDWPRDDPKWFWILWRPLPGHSPWPREDRELYIECFRLILARCHPNVRGEHYGQMMLHEVIARDHEDKATLARILLDAGAKTDVRDDLLKSTPLGWACRWGRVESVKLLLERGADPVEADAELWARPLAWAEKTNHPKIAALLREVIR